VEEQAIWRIRTNQELQELYKDLDIAVDIKKERLKWTGHLDGMDLGRVVKNILGNKLKGRGTKRPRLRGWRMINPLNPELNPICYLLALLGVHHFLHISRIRVKLLTFR